jgi:hypothetical protein
VSKCKGGPTQNIIKKVDEAASQKSYSRLALQYAILQYCNIKQEVQLVLNDMAQSSKTRVVYCKASFLFNERFLFLNFQPSTATGSSDVY